MVDVRNGSPLTAPRRRRGFCVLQAVGVFCVAVSAWAAPAMEWDNTYDYAYYDNARELIGLDDGGYALVAEAMTDDYDLSGLLIRLDAEGDTLWSARYDSLGELFTAVKQTPDQGFIMGGRAVSNVVDFVLCKTDEAGAIEWIKTYDMGADDAIADIALSADGGYVAVGTTKRASTDENLAVLKIDGHGDSVWAQEYNASVRSQGRTIAAIPEGGFLIAGFLQESGRDAWFLRIDEAGEEVWSKTLNPGDALCEINEVIVTGDGGFAAAGFFASGGIWGSADRFWVVRADAKGDTLWTSYFDGSSSEQALCILQTADDGFVALGQTESYGSGEEDMWLIRLNASGDSLWSRLVGSEYRDLAAGLAPAAGSGWALAGSSWLNSDERDLRVLKITETSVSAGPVARFSVSVDSGPAPMIAGFTDMSQGNPVSWQWDCDGDGVIDATEQNPVHTYDVAGSYSVTLIVSDGTHDDTLTRDELIKVTIPGSDDFAWRSFPRDSMWGEPNQHAVKSIAIDGDNTIICGTLGGVVEFDGHQWAGYKVSDNHNWPQIEAVAVDRGGVRWYSGPAGTWSFSGDDVLDSTGWTAHDLNIGDGQTMLAAADGNVWVGGAEGLARFDGKTWTVYNAEQLGLAAANIQHIAQAPTGEVWAATHEGAAVYDGAGWTGLNASDGMSDQRLVRVAVDSTGAVWLARYYGGLIQYAHGVFIDIESQQGELFYGHYVKGLAVAPDGAVWVRTDQGAYRYDGAQWRAFDTDNGLLSLYTECRNILFDSFGALWTGSAEGVSRYGPMQAPSAYFETDQSQGPAPLSVNFKDHSSGSILEWSWDFGDGSSSRGANPKHVYENAGIYTVTLTVADGRFHDRKTRKGLIVVSGDSSGNLSDFSIRKTSLGADSLLDQDDTLRIYFSQTLDNADLCTNIDIVNDSTNDRFACYGCLEEYAWFESDSILAIAFAYYGSLGKDTGTIGVALSGLENASGEVLPADTIWLRWDETVSAAAASVNPAIVWFAAIRNPVSAAADIELSLPRSQHVTMELVTLSGRRINQRYARRLPAGRRNIRWDLSAVAPGRYMCLIEAGEQRMIQPLIIAR